MSVNQTLKIRVHGSADVALSREMLHMFVPAFEDLNAYSEHQPDDAYLSRFLANRDCIAMVPCRTVGCGWIDRIRVGKDGASSIGGLPLRISCG